MTSSKRPSLVLSILLTSFIITPLGCCNNRARPVPTHGDYFCSANEIASDLVALGEQLPYLAEIELDVDQEEAPRIPRAPILFAQSNWHETQSPMDLFLQGTAYYPCVFSGWSSPKRELVHRVLFMGAAFASGVHRSAPDTLHCGWSDEG